MAGFSSWIYTLAEAASTVTIPNIANSKPARNESRSNAKKGNTFLNTHSENASPGPSVVNKSNPKTRSSDECPVCKGGCKTVDKCKRFSELSRDARWAAVREFSLCRRCLHRHPGECQARCGKNGCQFRHHALLHNDQQQQTTVSTTSKPAEQPAAQSIAKSPKPESSSSATHGCHTHQSKSSGTLFRYLPVLLHGKRRSVRTYAFLDDGSALTLLDEELADELELEGEVNPLCLRWTGGTERQELVSGVLLDWR